MDSTAKVQKVCQPHLVVNNKVRSAETMRCHETQLVAIKNMTMEELFGGFNEIRIITFSYDVPIIGWFMDRFDYGEVLLGADFMVKKDTKAQTYAAHILSGIEYSAKEIRKYDDLIQKMIDGDLVIHSSTNILDHRKLYLLKSDDGRTRVITTSANMTKRAWSSMQMENVSFDDSEIAYDTYSKEFDTAWNMSVDIPYPVASAAETDDPEKANAAIKQVIETGKAVVLQAPDEDEKDTLTDYQYVIDMKEGRDKWLALLKDTRIRKTKDGLIEIKPKIVEKIKINNRKAKIKKVDVNKIVEKYPKLTFDYNTQSMLISGKEVNLHPTNNEVKSEIVDLLAIFDKYNAFVGTEPNKQKEIYYKLLNAMFASPFFARLRCEARLINKGTTSLPLYLLISSSHASTGKSFFVKAILKMMTGKKNLRILAAKECSTSVAPGLQMEGSGVPLFIDEIDNSYLSRMKSAIKTSDQICEMRQKDDVPLIIFASNDVTDPDMQLRKRMIFLNPEGTIPSDADQTGWLSAGNSMISRLGNALYREYIRRMIPKVWELIDKMESNNGADIPDDWYPDIMPLSSNILIEIMKDYGFDVPDFFKPLTWKDDFAENASYITADAFREIKEMYHINKKAFIVAKDTVTIEVGSDKANVRRVQSWANVMPTEVMKKAPMSSRSGWTVVFDRQELEKRIGFKFKKKLFGCV